MRRGARFIVPSTLVLRWCAVESCNYTRVADAVLTKKRLSTAIQRL